MTAGPLLIGILLLSLLGGCANPVAESGLARGIVDADWTVAFYYDADNNLESYMMEDMAELAAAARPDYPVNLVALIDRGTDPYVDAEPFGEDFQDTRLYQFTGSSPIPLEPGVERDMGDIATLRWFIDYVKSEFPARHYALVIGNHGSGLGDYNIYGSKAICYDDTNETFISIRDFSSGLSAKESVELLILDACFMGYVELGYELAPIRSGLPNAGFTSDYLLSSPHEVVAEGFPYDAFLEGLYTAYNTDGFRPTGAALGAIMLAAQREHLKQNPSGLIESTMCYSLVDLARIDAFKRTLDDLASRLAGRETEAIQAIFGNSEYFLKIANNALFYYFDPSRPKNWLYYPGVDAASLLEALRSDENFAELGEPINACLTALDAMILDSMGAVAYPGFAEGLHGLALFFPKGSVKYFTTPVWELQTWYGPEYLAWSRDGVSADAVGNWFQLLDSWWRASSSY